jgi:hypothetical protein
VEQKGREWKREKTTEKGTTRNILVRPFLHHDGLSFFLCESWLMVDELKLVGMTTGADQRVVDMIFFGIFFGSRVGAFFCFVQVWWGKP